MTITGLAGDGGRSSLTHDAVVIVPGIMGTELQERASGRLVWGLADPRWYARSWREDGLAPLALTSAEREAVAQGRYDPGMARIVPGGLLRVVAALPVLRGVEPYSDLVKSIRSVVVDRAAILEFGYDWRLPVSFNARLLATAMRRHLAGWRDQSAHEAARRDGPVRRPAQLVIVAHSMGGLLAQELSTIEGATDDLRLTITLGTPFHGAVKAAELLNTGRGAPLPMRRGNLRDVVATMPGVHDLLPAYRCLLTDASDGVPDVVRPSVADLVDIGADQDLAEIAIRDYEERVGAALIGHRALIGTEQPTTQSMSVREGAVYSAHRSYHWDDGELQRNGVGQPLWTDERGDSTVFRYAATLDGVAATPVVQSHGGLAKAKEVLGVVRGLLLERPWSGAKLGEGDIGVDVPDLLAVGESFDLVVTGEDDPGLVDVLLTRIDADRDVPLPPPSVGRYSGVEGLRASLRLAEPGLYRVGVKTGGSDPVTQLVICGEPDD